ncbi:type IV pilus assembly protein PilF [Thiohalospira halophila DSM 15071]|uniref:Type IV pilus assembly protein PilF n=1 Tax=Thiohalospira halophila DSM 15071 TaxID=1123397 RepID=A0A1I1R085_9GAMM|nr:type IV pilus biogenesis/stability protein PilW [Thiohalospira halophila]SFD23680.1 type IV pilus assembly protein PilF [Thiohalospira halophila DSM 15071]
MRRKLRALSAVILLAALLAGCASAPSGSAREDAEAADANARLGLAYLEQGDYQRARTKLQRALKFAPEHADAHHYLAELYRRLEEPERAREHYAAALEATPEAPALNNNVGVFRCEQGEVDGAVAAFETAAADPVYERRAHALGNAGECLKEAQRLEEAAAYYRRALAVDGAPRRFLRELAGIQYQREAYLSARGFLERYIDAVDEPAMAALELGARIERALGNPAGARAYRRDLEERNNG